MEDTGYLIVFVLVIFMLLAILLSDEGDNHKDNMPPSPML